MTANKAPNGLDIGADVQDRPPRRSVSWEWCAACHRNDSTRARGELV